MLLHHECIQTQGAAESSRSHQEDVESYYKTLNNILAQMHKMHRAWKYLKISLSIIMNYWITGPWMEQNHSKSSGMCLYSWSAWWKGKTDIYRVTAGWQRKNWTDQQLEEAVTSASKSSNTWALISSVPLSHAQRRTDMMSCCFILIHRSQYNHIHSQISREEPAVNTAAQFKV